jgi:hypothetical protein
LVHEARESAALDGSTNVSSTAVAALDPLAAFDPLGRRRRRTALIRSRALAIAASLTLALVPGAAHADASDADRATARALANEGHEALERRDYAAAYDCFRRADALFHAPTLLLGLARAQVGLGKLVSAGETYQRLVNEPVTERAHAVSIAAIEDGNRELEQLNPRIPSVIILVKGPEATEVTLDGLPVPHAALGVKRLTDPGTHVVQATGAKGKAPPVTLTVAEGQVKTVFVELTTIASQPPLFGAGAISSPQKTLGLVALGLGGAGAAIGILSGAVAIVDHGALANTCNGGICPASQVDTLARYHTAATFSTVGFIAGGVGLAAGFILVFSAPHAQPSGRSAAPSVAVRAGLGSIRIEGTLPW